MVTNNFKKILFGGIFGSTSSSYDLPSFGSINLVNTSGSYVTIKQAQYANSDNGYHVNVFVNALNNLANAGNYGSSTIKVGTGTTTPTQNDYKMQNEATGITCDATSTGFTSNLTKTYTATFSNSTVSDINITELGLFVQDYNENDFLLDRTVLSTPITIPAGQSKSITYEIAF